MRVRVAFVVCCAVLTAGVLVASPASPIAPGLTNLGIAGVGTTFTKDGIVVIPVPEATQGAGGTDLNSDGDKGDTVIHIWDAASGAMTNTHLAGTFSTAGIDGGLVAFTATESAQGALGTDLNSDGDTADSVVRVWNAATGVVTNLGVAVLGSGVSVAAGVVAFLVPEGSQGAGGTDLNGDGDKFDNVVHVWHVSTGTTTNLGLVGFGLQVGDGGVVTFSVSEVAQGGTDLNGDGDTADNVFHAWRPGTGTTNVGRATSSSGIARGGVVAFPVVESAQGNTDLNGDGDTTDTVLQVWSATSGIVSNLGLAVPPSGSLIPSGGGVIAFQVSEAAQGNVILNGDGDTTDNVWHIWKASTATTTNLGLASGFPGPGGVVVAPDGSFVGFVVGEAVQGFAHLNGDADTTDNVLHVWNAGSGVTTNLGFAVNTFPASISGELMAFLVDEVSQGGSDLNGDGDAGDRVLHVWNAATDVTTNVSLAAATGPGSTVPVADNGNVALFVSEAAQGNADGNGDGDTADNVLHIWNAASGTTTNVGVAGALLSGNSGIFGFFVTEGAQGAGGTDLNGDGDANDLVPHVWAAAGVDAFTRQAPAGATVTSDGEGDGATPADPIETSVTTPTGGAVSILEGAVTASPPPGFTLLGYEAHIDAPAATATSPLTIVFRLDASLVPAGEDETTIQVFRDGAAVATCSGGPGVASPDPCVSARQRLADNDVQLTVLSSHASDWTFGITSGPPPYPFSGFSSPVENLPALNVAKAGQAIPVKFSLGGDHGLEVLAAGYPASAAHACDAPAPADATAPVDAAGRSSLTYDAASGQYVYVWKTDKAWSDTCRVLVVKLNDGSVHRADFHFTR